MANYTTTITNEGAALLASVIANQGTLTFNEFRFSENDYNGQESTLTEGTFLGVFITASAAASVIDSTTIKASAQFNNSTITGNHDLYSIGIVGTDGNTTALIAVCTTTDPDVIREPLTGTSTYAFNVNLTVSDTSQITVVGTTAAVLYDIDVVDTLTSTATNKPLSANQGRVLADNLAANEESGAKNHADSSTATTAQLSNNNGVFTNTVADDYSYFYMYIQAWTGGTFISNIANQSITATGDCSYNITIPSGTDTLQIIHNGGIYDLRAKFNCNVEGDYIISFRVLGTDPRTIGGLSFDKVMLYDARILDPTFVPFAKTNQQLTADKAERSDLATLNLTGSTNTTGSTINANTYFYLNGSYCKTKTTIANGATFTLNTNFEVVTVGGELNAINTWEDITSQITVDTTKMPNGTVKVYKKPGFVYISLRAVNFDNTYNDQPIVTGLPTTFTGDYPSSRFTGAMPSDHSAVVNNTIQMGGTTLNVNITANPSTYCYAELIYITNEN